MFAGHTIGRQVTAVVLGSGILLGGCSLTQRPPRTAVSQPPPAMPVSDAVVGAKLSLQGLKNHLETIVPPVYRDQGDEEIGYRDDPCDDIGVGHCPVYIKTCDYTWYTEVRRSPFVVTPVAGGLSVSSTVRLWGRVRTHGPLCVSAQETTEPDGIMTLTVNARPAFNELYALEPNVSYNSWNWQVRPGIRLFGAIPVTFGSKAKEAIDDALRDITEKTNRDLRARLNFRGKVEEGWAQLHEPIPLASGEEAWLSVKPLSLHVTPLISDPDYVRIYAGLRSRNEAVFGPRPAAHDVVGLPILKPANQDGKFALAALARVDYEALVERAKQEWVGQTLMLDWGRLTFRDFRVYQSGDRLVIGADVVVRPRTLPYVEGWLYLAGRPVVEGDRLFLRDLDYRANTSNAAVQALAFLFREPAKRELERRLSFDLREPLDELRAKVNSVAPKPLGEWGEVRVTVDDVSVQSPVADAKALLVPIVAQGKAEASFLPFGDAP